MARKSTLPRRLQPMLATLTDAPFDDPDWVFEDKFDGFRMVAEVRGGRVALYSRNGKIISHSYVEVAKALEGVKTDAVIDGELVAIIISNRIKRHPNKEDTGRHNSGSNQNQLDSEPVMLQFFFFGLHKIIDRSGGSILRK